jgi:beta-lactamase class A
MSPSVPIGRNEQKQDFTMRLFAPLLPRLAAGLVFNMSIATAVLAQTSVDALFHTIAQVEDRLGARVGMTLADTGSDRSWSHRADERFLMNSTVKVPVCGAVLALKDAGALSLAETLPVTQADIVSHAPVTEDRVGRTMSLAELCLAAIDMSDNTATNLLIRHVGGPAAVTAFFRTSGDTVSRLDRFEPKLNAFAPGDPRDTTSPAAMTTTMRNLLLGDVLTPDSRDTLAEWMRSGGVTGALLRAEAPSGWQILDKSGAGNKTRNLTAVVTPDAGAPWIVTIFISDTDAAFKIRNAALREIARAVVDVIRN